MQSSHLYHLLYQALVLWDSPALNSPRPGTRYSPWTPDKIIQTSQSYKFIDRRRYSLWSRRTMGPDICTVWLACRGRCLLFCSVVQLYMTLWDPTECVPPGCSVHGTLQARTLEWVAISSSRGSSQVKDQPVSPARLHWQVDSSALSHPGNPPAKFSEVPQLFIQKYPS